MLKSVKKKIYETLNKIGGAVTVPPNVLNNNSRQLARNRACCLNITFFGKGK